MTASKNNKNNLSNLHLPKEIWASMTKEQQDAFNAGLKAVSSANKLSGKGVSRQLTRSTKSTPKDGSKKSTEESDSPSAGNILADSKKKTSSKERAFGS